MTEYILFKHPDLKIRKEKFGGIIKTVRGLFLIDKKAYCLLKKIDNKKTYSELTEENESKKVIEDLLKLKIILKIEVGRAERVKNLKDKN